MFSPCKYISATLLVQLNTSYGYTLGKKKLGSKPVQGAATLILEMMSIMCNGAEGSQADGCDPYGPRVQEQPLFLVCSIITIFTLTGLGSTSNHGADQKNGCF